MGEKKSKLIIILNIIVILSCITISFAWMDDMGYIKTNRFIEMIFGKDVHGDDKGNHIYIAPNTLDVQLFIENNDEYEQIGDSNSPHKNLFLKDNLAPDDIIKYNMIITNKTLVDANISVIFNNISSNYENIYNYVYMGLLSSKGFDYPYEPPYIDANNPTVEVCLADGLANTEETEKLPSGEVVNKKTYNFINNVTLPKGIVDKVSEKVVYQPVEIRFYIRISHEAKNDIQNKFLKIENLSFMVV